MDYEARCLPGALLGRYQLVRRIGRGGMGSVFEARHVDLNKRVALKTLKPEFAQQPAIRARFLREGVAASRIRHPNVADVTDVGVDDEIPYLVMEFLDGEDLAKRVETSGPLGVTETIDLMLPVLAAVSTAHDEGVVHRDLKPANIFLSVNRHGVIAPKVLDFGISKITDDGEEAQALTGTDAVLGTPFYMAPEQIAGARHSGPASDQYSLAVVMYYCLTKRLPYRGQNAFATMNLILRGEYTPPSAIIPTVPPHVENILRRAMHTDPDARFASVSDLGVELFGYASDEVQAQWRSVFGSEPGARTTRASLPVLRPPTLAGLHAGAFPHSPSAPPSLPPLPPTSQQQSSPSQPGISSPSISGPRPTGLALESAPYTLGAPAAPGYPSAPPFAPAITAPPAPNVYAMPTAEHRAPPGRSWLALVATALVAGVTLIALVAWRTVTMPTPTVTTSSLRPPTLATPRPTAETPPATPPPSTPVVPRAPTTTPPEAPAQAAEAPVRHGRRANGTHRPRRLPRPQDTTRSTNENAPHVEQTATGTIIQ